MTYKNIVWMKVSHDDLSLPEAVAGSVEELADILHISTSYIYDTRVRYNKGIDKKEKFVRIEIDEED